MEAAQPRSTAWRYYVCGLLLLATTINYLDRQVLSNTSVRIKTDLGLNNEQYGELETYFGIAFAIGAMLFGWLADKTGVRWLYPAVLFLWSAMGFCTGLVTDFANPFVGLLVCRTLLGLFEAGHWPCALKTTQRFFTKRERTLSNSILQSGSSVGAIASPLIVSAMLTPDLYSWSAIFKVVGIVGMAWVFLWIPSFRRSDFQGPPVEPEETPAAVTSEATKQPKADAAPPGPPGLAGGLFCSLLATAQQPFWSVLLSRRFVALLVMVFGINVCWHIFRVWLPSFLEEGRGYSGEMARAFNSSFYVATDIGCILAGFATVWLTKQRWSVYGARLLVYTCCALLTSASIAIYWLPQGYALIAVLLTVGAGALGLFPCYYSFSQDLSVAHQGKITGLLSAFAWVTVAVLHKYNGRFIDVAKQLTPDHAYDLGMMLSGACPLLGTLAMLLLWNRADQK